MEAIELLQARFNQPHLIHQAEYWTPLALKEGSRKELCNLHDIVQQHLRAIDYEPSGAFITSIFELKLDTMTMFEWQKHS